MRFRMILPALLALAGALAIVGPAAAQDPYAEYNRSRAYQHYLSSNAPVRSYSGSVPGLAWRYDTPWESERYYRSPSYYGELLTPYDREVRHGPVWVEKDVIRRPVLVAPPPPAYVPVYPNPYR